MHLHSLEKTIGTVWAELLKRYGEDPGELTRPQIDATASEIHLNPEFLPYLYATFLSEGEFQTIRRQLPGIDWPGAEQAAQTALSSLQHTRPPLTGSFRGPMRHL